MKFLFNSKADHGNVRLAEVAYAALAIFSIVFLAYSVVIYNTFGVLDDYSFLYNAITGENGTISLLIGAGRPLNALLLDKGFAYAGTIEGLSILRLLTLAGVWILGLGLYLFSRFHGIELFTSLLIAVGAVLLPSFHVYISWAQHFTTPYAGIIALIAAFILTPACAFREHYRIAAVLSSATILVVSLLIYQPLAMLFWAGILLSFSAKIGSESEWSNGRFFDVLCAFALSMIVAFIVFKYGQHLYPSESARYGLVGDVYGKFFWFLREPLANALSLYLVPTKFAMQVAILLGLVFCILFVSAAYGVKAAARVGTVVLLSVLASYAPNLVTAENWASYRSIGALQVTIFVALIMILRLCVIHSLKRYGSADCARWPVGLIFAPAVIVVVFLASASQASVSKGFVLPNAIELNNLASFLRGLDVSSDESPAFVVKASSWRDSGARVLLYDEFGMHSSLGEQYSAVILKIALRSLGLAPRATVSLYDESNRRAVSDGLGRIIVDFSDMATSERFKTNLPQGGGLSRRFITPANISDGNWSAGIWKNQGSPGAYSFTYKLRYDDLPLQIGDRLKFQESGIRSVVKYEVNGGYANVLVEGSPLSTGDGYPRDIGRF